MRASKIIGMGIVLSSLGLIAYQATKNESIVTFFTPEEVYAAPQKFENKTFRVSGFVLEGTKKWDSATQTLTFQMSDLKDHTFFVTYKGMPPDLFKERQGVIVEGRLDPTATSVIPQATSVIPRLDRGIQSLNALRITANLLMVKHSEVYNTQENHDQMREIKLRESLFNDAQRK